MHAKKYTQRHKVKLGYKMSLHNKLCDSRGFNPHIYPQKLTGKKGVNSFAADYGAKHYLEFL